MHLLTVGIERKITPTVIQIYLFNSNIYRLDFSHRSRRRPQILHESRNPYHAHQECYYQSPA